MVGATSKQAQVALFTQIVILILCFVDPIRIVKFFKKCDRNMIEIETEKAEVPILRVTPYNTSVNRPLLKHHVITTCFDHVAPDVVRDKLID